MADNVVFLKCKNDALEPDMMAFHACRHCKNKTFTLTEDSPDYFQLMRCAACGHHIGRVGWAPGPEGETPA